MKGKCAICGFYYVDQIGDQPDGTMRVQILPPGRCPLSGYEELSTILIQYEFPSGTQGSMHPNPGRSYRGTSRTAFLPMNVEGIEVLELLKRSFRRRRSFTVGTSITTGQSNCVIWNGVHHKTNTHGGCSCFGYPDPTYFSRVKEELAAKGIIP